MLTVDPPDGPPYEFRGTSALNVAWTCRPILEGRTYPALPFVTDVATIVDVGANCGSASIYFSQHYPTATVHAIEPGSIQLDCLRDNVRGFPNIQVHEIGLSNRDAEVDLHLAEDSGQASVLRSTWHSGETERITLRDAGRWAAEQGIDRIDLLKVDVEMSELDVFQSLADLLPEVSVIYLEFGSRTIRRAIEALLDPTHDLLIGHLTIDHGEIVYLRRDLADASDLKGPLLEIVRRREAPLDADVGADPDR